MSRSTSGGLAAACLAAFVAAQAPSAGAEVGRSPTPIVIAGVVEPIRTGPGNQTDPHISGTLVSYSNESADGSVREIRYQDLGSGVDAAIPTDGQYDSRSDVSGTTVVFRRVHTDGSSSARPILAFDTADPAAGTTLLGSDPEARTSAPSIGASTVAWVQYPGASTVSEIVGHTIGGPTVPLTSSGLSSQEPDASPDGEVVTWTTCSESGLACDVFAARKHADGTWDAATRISGDGSEDIHSATNGSVVAYASDMAGDLDIWWESLDGTGEHRLGMSGDEYATAMSGSLIVFVHQDAGGYTDLFAYDMATGSLYQLTDTPTVGEVLPDVAVDGDGLARVVWAQADGIGLGENDLYAMTFQVPGAGGYRICPQFDQSRSHRVGSTVPLRVRLCDDSGQNRSSPDAVLTATGLVKLDGSASQALAEDAGNANPDSGFRYDESSDQYIFNLSTRSLSAGTWQLDFTVTGDPTMHNVTFDLR